MISFSYETPEFPVEVSRMYPDLIKRLKQARVEDELLELLRDRIVVTVDGDKTHVDVFITKDDLPDNMEQ